MLPQQLLVDPRLVVEPLRVSRADELHQISIADIAGGENDQVVVRARVGGLIFHARLVEARSIGDIHLAADDRLHADRVHGVVELDRAEHIAVIRDGAGRHPQLSDFRGQWLGPGGAVEERILSVEMKVNEGHGALRFYVPRGANWHMSLCNSTKSRT